MRSNLLDFSSLCSHLTASQVPPKIVPSCGGGWALRADRRDQNDHQPTGSTYVSNTTLFSHERHTCYSGCLLICIIFKSL